MMVIGPLRALIDWEEGSKLFMHWTNDMHVCETEYLWRNGYSIKHPSEPCSAVSTIETGADEKGSA